MIIGKSGLIAFTKYSLSEVRLISPSNLYTVAFAIL
nr:MAG TPA: hypothetical protein [Caudoviricetes sp.]DAV30593.1 MAG TPA: hypothetical protein [Caudoviricetes sp.]